MGGGEKEPVDSDGDGEKWPVDSDGDDVAERDRGADGGRDVGLEGDPVETWGDCREAVMSSSGVPGTRLGSGKISPSGFNGAAAKGLETLTGTRPSRETWPSVSFSRIIVAAAT